MVNEATLRGICKLHFKRTAGRGNFDYISMDMSERRIFHQTVSFQADIALQISADSPAADERKYHVGISFNYSSNSTEPQLPANPDLCVVP